MYQKPVLSLALWLMLTTLPAVVLAQWAPSGILVPGGQYRIVDVSGEHPVRGNGCSHPIPRQANRDRRDW